MNFDENCGAVVRTLLTARRLSHNDLLPVLGIQVHTVHRALNGERHWRMDELDALARFFDVPVSVFFDTPEALLRNRCFSLDTDSLLDMTTPQFVDALVGMSTGTLAPTWSLV